MFNLDLWIAGTIAGTIVAVLVFCFLVLFIPKAKASTYLRVLMLFAVAIGFGSGSAVAWFLTGACRNSEEGRIANSGSFEVLSFMRNCGATTPMVFAASIVGRGEALPDGAGNLFNLRNLPSEIRLEWIDEHTLSICTAGLSADLADKLRALPDRVGSVAVRNDDACR